MGRVDEADKERRRDYGNRKMDIRSHNTYIKHVKILSEHNYWQDRLAYRTQLAAFGRCVCVCAHFTE